MDLVSYMYYPYYSCLCTFWPYHTSLIYLVALYTCGIISNYVNMALCTEVHVHVCSHSFNDEIHIQFIWGVNCLIYTYMYLKKMCIPLPMYCTGTCICVYNAPYSGKLQGRKLSQVALNPRNLWMFSPSKVFCYGVCTCVTGTVFFM